MRKKDLRTGMRVETRDGKKYVVIKETFNFDLFGIQKLLLIRDNNKFILGENIKNDLTSSRTSRCDIVKIYKPPINKVSRILNSDYCGELIWRRKNY